MVEVTTHRVLQPLTVPGRQTFPGVTSVATSMAVHDEVGAFVGDGVVGGGAVMDGRSGPMSSSVRNGLQKSPFAIWREQRRRMGEPRGVSKD